MSRLNTLAESNGPDRFRNSPGCARHHNGIRTDIKDYCCCCDPCSYWRLQESASEPENRLCCKCLPKVILVKFSGTNGHPCCRDEAMILVGRVAILLGKRVILYSGSILDHAISVYISNDEIAPGQGRSPDNSYDDGYYGYYGSNGPIGPCRWTISIPSLNIDHEVEIDHTIVTCLGVPSVTITGVSGRDGCVGVLTLFNYTTVKVPFESVQNPQLTEGSTEPLQSAMVPFPYGFVDYDGELAPPWEPDGPYENQSPYLPEKCKEIPRWICFSTVEQRPYPINGDRTYPGIKEARVFEWDEYFEPSSYWSTNGTFYDSQDDYWVIGRWTWSPFNWPVSPTHNIWLIQDYYGRNFLQPDFNTPNGIYGDQDEQYNPVGVNVGTEEYARIELLPENCNCNFKVLHMRSTNEDVNAAFDLTWGEEQLANQLKTTGGGSQLRAGRCGCFKYRCGKRRCVPRYLCGTLYVNGSLYLNILFTWSNSQKCWVGQGGTDVDGYPMPFSLNICLGSPPSGQGLEDGCVVTVAFLSDMYEDYDIEPVYIGDRNTVISGNLAGTNAARDSYFILNFNTSFDGDCNLLLTCTQASPCTDNCGSHPPILYLNLRGWSLPTDYPPPPITGDCSLEIVMYYRHVDVVTTDGDGIGVVLGCDYVGYAVVQSAYTDPLTGITTMESFVIKAVKGLGGLSIYRWKVGDPESTIPERSVELQTETCPPYYGYYYTNCSLCSCFFGDQSIIFMRWEAEITE